MIIMVSLGIVFAGIQVAGYVVHNKRVAQGKHKSEGKEAPMIYTP